jgi:RNA polymerase sigma-70 factor, ECF subfamily
MSNKRRPPTSTYFDAEESESFEEASLLQEVSTPENELMSKQVVNVVQASLLQLPEDLRSALTLREIEGLSYEEIAAVMSCPVGTVRSRIFRAREAIAENLRPLLETSKGKRW